MVGKREIQVEQLHRGDTLPTFSGASCWFVVVCDVGVLWGWLSLLPEGLLQALLWRSCAPSYADPQS